MKLKLAESCEKEKRFDGKKNLKLKIKFVHRMSNRRKLV